jgi:hypothetical protein
VQRLPAVGFGALLVVSLCSALASVWFERLVKARRLAWQSPAIDVRH